jgi:hypothetical protein
MTGVLLRPSPQDNDILKSLLPPRGPIPLPTDHTFLAEADVPDLIQVAR